jgi:hypothetical protein
VVDVGCVVNHWLCLYPSWSFLHMKYDTATRVYIRKKYFHLFIFNVGMKQVGS